MSDGQYSINYPGYGDVMGNYWTPTNTNAIIQNLYMVVINCQMVHLLDNIFIKETL